MTNRLLLSAGLLAVALSLPACERKPESKQAPAPAQPPAAPVPTVQWTSGATSPDLAAPVLTPEAEKGEKGARNVLLEWASAVERKDFARAAAQWGEGADLAAKDEAARFAGMGPLTVTLGEGGVEGGAGSLYYGVPVSVSDGERTLSGEIVLRRVNDVDGASPAQLRWHIGQLTLAP